MAFIVAPATAAAVSSTAAAGSAKAVSTGTILSVGSTIAGGVVSAVGSSMSAGAQADAAATQAAIFQQQADSRRRQAQADAKEKRRRDRAIIARRIALAGGRGLDVTTGTPIRIAGDMAAISERQRLKILSGGAIDANRLEQRGFLESRRAGGALTAGTIRGIGQGVSVLGKAGELFG